MNKIKELREQRGLTQRQFADKLGITLCMVRTYEQGIRTPQLNTALKMAEFLNTKVEEIFKEVQNV